MRQPSRRPILLTLALGAALAIGACSNPSGGASAQPSASDQMMEHPSASDQMMEHPSASDEMMEHPSASPSY
jgi:hypothetical protein